MGLRTTFIPYPINLQRVVAEKPEPRYLTFINPQPAKGVTVFARIAAELDRIRPDIPVLVVEGRGRADGLANAGLDLSGLQNLNRMANTPDPRDFYRVSRAVLVPSLWRESFGRVAAETLANALPVLASDRGALPETLGEAGFPFTLPGRCTPTSGEVPTAKEVAPWIATAINAASNPYALVPQNDPCGKKAPTCRGHQGSLVPRLLRVGQGRDLMEILYAILKVTPESHTQLPAGCLQAKEGVPAAPARVAPRAALRRPPPLWGRIGSAPSGPRYDGWPLQGLPLAVEDRSRHAVSALCPVMAGRGSRR